MLFLRKPDDRGFSLVELIVVILIIGVLSTGTTFALSSVYHADAERAAKKICNLMATARAKAMADDGDLVNITVKITQDAEGNNIAGIYRYEKNPESGVWDAGTLVEEAEKLSNYKVEVLIGPKNSGADDGSRKALGDDYSSIEYSFKKSSGGIDWVKTDGTIDKDDVTNVPIVYADIIVEGASTYKIIVVPATGRCNMSEGT